MSKKKLNLLIILIFVFFAVPNVVMANTVVGKMYKGLGEQKYYMYNYSGERHTDNLMTFRDKSSGANLFCIEPGQSFGRNSQGKLENTYTVKEEVPKLYNNKWVVNKKEITKVMSCVPQNTTDGETLIAAQAIIWELISKERAKIDNSKIFSKDPNYAPYRKDGSRYLANSKANSLYELIKKDKKIYDKYKKILECAARFNVTPSWANSKKEMEFDSPATATTKAKFKAEISLDGNISQTNLFKYYKCTIGNKTVNCKDGTTVDGITFKCYSKICTFTTQKDNIKQSNPVKVTFTYAYAYAYKNDLIPLSTNETRYYSSSSSSAKQKLMRGSTSKSFNLYLYSGTAPKYKIKLKKVDSNENIIKSGTAKFTVYNDKKLTQKACEIKTKNGVGECTVSRIGYYYIVETQAPTGFIKNSEKIRVKVIKDDTEENDSDITVHSIENASRILHMNKYTIDPLTGKRILLSGDSCKVATCEDENGVRENGPIFNITNGNKYVCVSESTNGTYIYNSLSKNENCPSGTTNKIKTCGGTFDIKNIPPGEYTVVEIATVCGASLPKKFSKKIEIEEKTEKINITMTNNFSGVIFNKLDENGSFISGGKFALQKSVNGIYKDIPLKHQVGSVYVYDSSLEVSSENIILETSDGIINVRGLPVGNYRFVEKEAPEGYELIKDKDSTAVFTIKDSSTNDNAIQVDLINKQKRVEGSYDSAELIVTIITGRKVANYALIITGLAILLTLFIILRNKFKK